MALGQEIIPGEFNEDAERYRWLRDVAGGPARDTALDMPCGLVPGDPGYDEAHKAAVDAEVDRLRRGGKI